MPIRGSSTAPVTPVHRLVAIPRNRWSQIVTAGRDHPVRPALAEIGMRARKMLEA
jgi:hypothetical protein